MKAKKTYIHVNQHVIRSNKKNERNDSVITVKQGRKNDYCTKWLFSDPQRLYTAE